MGPRTAISGVKIVFRIEPFEEPAIEDLMEVEPVPGLDFGTPPNPEFEDWRRVFTTSKGHVKIAPIVPPTLLKNNLLYIFICIFYAIFLS